MALAVIALLIASICSKIIAEKGLNCTYSFPGIKFTQYFDIVLGVNKGVEIMTNIRDYLNLTTTAALGSVGVATGNIPLQIAAFFPAIACKISSDLANCFSNAGSINNELKSLLKEVCNSTQEKLSQTSKEKGDFFRYAKARIEEGIDNVVPVPKFVQTMQQALNTEVYEQATYMTSNDVSEISKLFVECFISALPNYPKLRNHLLEITLIDHESRITALEMVKPLIPDRISTLPNEVVDDTQYYYNKFNEPLFLHRKLPEKDRIALKHVYTLPGANIEKQYRWNKMIRKNAEKEADMDKSYANIVEAIREFIEYSPQMPGEEVVDILFLEGKAAMGKSSLISWLCWNYVNAKDEAKEFLGKRCLLTIKMRDIPHSDNGLLNIQSPFLQLCAYLLRINEKDLASIYQWEETSKKLFTNALLVLEGFDELCMLEGIVGVGKNLYFQNLYQELNRMDCDCKIIVTTRPEYLNVEGLDFPKAHVAICPFTETKRKEWIEKYESFYPVPSSMKKALIYGCTPILDGIVDSPLTLYMIVARNVHISNNSNLWYIYHEIFAEEVYKRDYENGVPHAINTYRKLLYRLTAEIANAVSREQHLSIAVDKLLDIKQIRKLLDQLGGEGKNIRDILEDCFGLASYFRISEKEYNNGKIISAVEFYHNNIKDYFYCEFLWLHLENIYSNIPSNLQEQEEWFIGCFQELFQYSVCLKDSSEGVRARAIDFLESKILYLKENNIPVDFVHQELKQHYFEHFFGKMLQTGFLRHYEYTGKDNILHMMACIYSSVLSIYHTIYLPYLAHNERLALAEEPHVVDIGTSLIYRILFITSNLHDLSYIKFDGIMLSGIKFGKHNFQNSSFRGCLLIGCNFDECDLRGADFSSASLKNADFRNAIIDDSTVFSTTTEFGRTKIKRDQLPYFTPYVGEDLFYADIESVTYIAPMSQE